MKPQSIIQSLIFLAITIGLTQVSQAIVEKPEVYVLCKNSKIVRSIRIFENDEGENKCVTLYTKAGVDRVVGKGRNFSSCRSVLNNIRGNLESATWTCRDITAKSKITVSESYYQ